MTYYITYGLLLLVNFALAGRRLGPQVFYYIALVGLFFFSGYRLWVGCDWTGYLSNYFGAANMSYSQALQASEPMHWSLLVFMHQFDLPYPYLNVVTSGIFFAGLHVLARRQPNPLAFLVLCFPILIINMPMSAVRQAAAIGFMCIAFSAFLDRRLFLYLGTIFVGSLFHSSIAAFVLLAPFVRGNMRRRNLYAGALLIFPAAFALAQGDAAGTASSRYIGTGVDAAGAAFRLGVLCLSGLFFLLYLRRPWQRFFPHDYRLALIGGWTMVLFIGLFPISSVIGDRFGYYLIPLQAMIFARIPYLPLRKNSRLYTLAPYALLTLVFLVWTQLSSHFHKCYLPYQFELL